MASRLDTIIMLCARLSILVLFWLLLLSVTSCLLIALKEPDDEEEPFEWSEDIQQEEKSMVKQVSKLLFWYYILCRRT